ncbi:MAG: hypothetical protein GY719_25080 [bacterium]|nr:hypothetical protein [bacterium]
MLPASATELYPARSRWRRDRCLTTWANLTAGHGDSLNAFDVTAAVLVAGVGFVAGAGSSRPPGLYPLPAEVWRAVAADATEVGDR